MKKKLFIFENEKKKNEAKKKVFHYKKRISWAKGLSSAGNEFEATQE